MKFEVKGIGAIDAVGWVLWQRTDDCDLPEPDTGIVSLPKGFGVLFESIPLETRAAIAALVARQASSWREYRFRPRYRGVALSAIGVGGSLGGVAIAASGSRRSSRWSPA